MYFKSLASIVAIASFLSLSEANNLDCACGYLDPVTGDLWTDSTIVYFNETESADFRSSQDFVAQNYVNQYESGFDVIYRQAASPENVQFNSSDNALQLVVEPSTKDHLVRGGGIISKRRDIQYGSFRAFLQPPQTNMGGGSALSMIYYFNESEAIHVNLMNTNNAETAQLSWRVQLPRETLEPVRTNFTTLDRANNRAWEIQEYRFDWTEKMIKFTTGLNETTQWNITETGGHHIPSLPGAAIFKHWSTGSESNEQGPPEDHTVGAWVGYIRIFFNSTITSTHDTFDAQCKILGTPVCSTDNHTLRNSTLYPEESTQKWTQYKTYYVAPKWAVYGNILTGVMFGLLVAHALVRRAIRHFAIPKSQRPVHPPAYAFKLDRYALHGELTRDMRKHDKKAARVEKKRNRNSRTKSRLIESDLATIASQDNDSVAGTSLRGFSALSKNKSALLISKNIPTMYYAKPASLHGGREDQNKIIEEEDEDEYEDDDSLESPTTSRPGSPSEESQYTDLRRGSDETDDRSFMSVPVFAAAPMERKKSVMQKLEVRSKGFAKWFGFFDSGDDEKAFEGILAARSDHIEHLDGLRGLACFMVSLVHFALTFYPAWIEDTAPRHYGWETWIRKIISPFWLNANFGIAIFFILSSRLIGARYLKGGSLQDLAGSTFRRLPRLAFPVLCAVLLEYFLIGVGATEWLIHLPSVSWSSWPYVKEFPNPGWFLNEVIALLFVKPPNLPSIIYNYCTGVLWTIPISLQMSWLIFLGVIVIREIKTPWKRFGYYAFCIVNSWYALDWGAYFWVGLAICDLDTTYKYRYWFTRQWRSWLAVLSVWLIVLAAMGTQWAQQSSYVRFPTWENGIHPNLYTGMPIAYDPQHRYPAFNLPQGYSLFAATGVILLCDLSSLFQTVFSWRPLRALGYYSYSMYLLHGVVFWTWGSWLAVTLSVKGVVYWLNISIVFFTSYFLLFVAVYFWTPFADVFAQYLSTAVWRYAQGRSFFATM